MRDPNAVYLALYSRSLCCEVRTASIAIAAYYLVSNLVVCAGMAVWIINGIDLGGFSHPGYLTHGQKEFDITTNFLLLIVPAISCVLALVGLRRGCSTHLVPLIAQLYVDVGLSVMSLFCSSWGLPGTPTIEQTNRLVSHLTGGRVLGPQEMSRITMIFGLLFVLYLLAKVHAAHIMAKCYYVLKLAENGNNSQKVEKGVSVQLPSYDDAVKLPPKDQPPVYQQLP
ncbi:hypothetical protein AAFF_G00242580 [Aldrovandia affinis]|uniref:Uncharacterized protein n=1 Tax=Aldrovandia affinis TaxID=143900 RepID=A0AAD7W3W6_9TELE|nr:hypothetical protein AAFF_G00242580 [Aldrovandia affinis]